MYKFYLQLSLQSYHCLKIVNSWKKCKVISYHCLTN